VLGSITLTQPSESGSSVKYSRSIGLWSGSKSSARGLGSPSAALPSRRLTETLPSWWSAMPPPRYDDVPDASARTTPDASNNRTSNGISGETASCDRENTATHPGETRTRVCGSGKLGELATTLLLPSARMNTRSSPLKPTSTSSSGSLKPASSQSHVSSGGVPPVPGMPATPPVVPIPPVPEITPPPRPPEGAPPAPPRPEIPAEPASSFPPGSPPNKRPLRPQAVRLNASKNEALRIPTVSNCRLRTTREPGPEIDACPAAFA